MTTHTLHGFKITTQDEHLVAVEFPPHRPPASFDATALEELLHFLDRYSPDQSSTSPFYRQVYQAMQTIPLGSSWTYAKLADQAGSPRAARAVGSACSRNPMPVAVPCHRVVSAAGIGAFSGGPGWKHRLLALEKELAESQSK